MILPIASPTFCACCLSDRQKNPRYPLPGFDLYPRICVCDGISLLCRKDGQESVLFARLPEGASAEELEIQFPRTVQGQKQTLLDETAIDNPLFQYYLTQLLANAVPLLQPDGQATAHDTARNNFADTFCVDLTPAEAADLGIDTHLSCPLTGSYLFAKSDGQGGYSYAMTIVGSGEYRSERIELIAIHLLEWSLCECDYLSELAATLDISLLD